MGATLQINGSAFSQINSILEQLGQPQQFAALKRGARAEGKKLEQRLRDNLPKPGYPGDKDELIQLRQNLGTKVNEYQNGRIIVVTTGYEYGGRAPHGHLVEEGHELVLGGTSSKPGKGRKLARKAKSGFRGTGTARGFVEGRHHLEHAVDSTESERGNAMAAAMRESIEEVTRG